VDITATLDAPCSPAELFGWVGDLARYPEWLSIVTRAVPLAGVERAGSVPLASVEPVPAPEPVAGAEPLAGSEPVGGVEPVAGAEPLAGAEPAWSVDLRGRLGPLARSKRLRMVRTKYRPDELAVFERAEADGRRHSAWVLRAEVSAGPTAAESRLVMRLHYGGSFWGPVLERLLADEIDTSRQRLLALVSA
jgi:hypothetical protein